MTHSEVLSDDAKLLRTGYTTGSSAVAAAKAALTTLLTEKESQIEEIAITLPNGSKLQIPIEAIFKSDTASITAVVIKDAGDDADVTHGLEICAKVTLNHTGKISIGGGVGVGKVTKPGLQIPVGAYAINPVPLKMIEDNLKPLLSDEMGVEVVIEVPHGEAAAAKTFNPRLGVIGGISIIGTSGIVRPMSEEAFKDTIYTEMKQKKALGVKTLVLVPGLHGEKFATENINLADLNLVKTEQVVHMGNYVGFALQAADKLGFQNIVLIGHTGKLIKLAGGIFNTHSKVADAKVEIMVSELALLGAPLNILQDISLANTTDEMSNYLTHTPYLEVFQILAEKARKRCLQFIFEGIDIEVILYDMSSRLLGDSRRRQEK